MTNAIDKDVAILEAVARQGGPHRLADLARWTGVTKPSVHRVLQEMAKIGYVAISEPGMYLAGPRLRELAYAVMSGDSRWSETATVLTELCTMTGYTVHFAVGVGAEAVYVAKLDAGGPYGISSRLGMRISLHCTAIGKCILAWMDAATLQGVRDRATLERRTNNTLTNWDDLIVELDRVHTEGYAVDDEENEENVRCVGAPVFARNGRAVGGVSSSGLTFQLAMADTPTLAVSVRSAAAKVSGLLGY